MQLSTADGTNLFTPTVERYGFPDEELGPTEDNPAEDFETERFLIVACTFRNAEGEWQARGPTMTTDELARLANWLESLRGDGVSRSGCYFTERDLEFEFDDCRKRLLVHVCRDFVPGWIDPRHTISIEFPLKDVDLDAAVNSIRQQLARFPGRPRI